MEQVAERQQVSAAAGREVGRDKTVIQRAESGFVRVRRPGQQGFQLLHHGQLRRTVAAGDQVGIRAVGNDRQQRPAAGLVEAVSCGQPFFQRGQTKLQHGGQTCFHLPPHPGDAVLHIELLPGGNGILGRDPRKVFCRQPGRHGRDFRQHAGRVGPDGTVQATQRRADDADGENSPLMGIDAMGGGQHLALSLAAQRAEGCKGLRGRAVRCFPPCPGAGLKIRIEGGRAAHKGKRIHIGVAAAVPAIHQAGLGGSGHLI